MRHTLIRMGFALASIAAVGAAEFTATASAAPVPAIAHRDRGDQPCVNGQLATSISELSPGSQHRGIRLTYNLAPGAGPCTLYGYPGLDTGGRVPAERTLRGYLGGLPDGQNSLYTVMVTPDHPARADVEWMAVDTSGNSCVTDPGFWTTPPNTTDTQWMPEQIQPCRLQIHPVVG
ncbi:DUF4232 domain-containing protein [Nocardia sp. NPDC088792]|uniref:DUF4232 domain-containing protein n=1 Tax=Nocardia sp. NPDC088792 TaxID=3364332 RepID=UPI00381E0C50